ncbi:unnamed protein product [Caretta caretta]
MIFYLTLQVPKKHILQYLLFIEGSNTSAIMECSTCGESNPSLASKGFSQHFEDDTLAKYVPLEQEKILLADWLVRTQ